MMMRRVVVDHTFVDYHHWSLSMAFWLDYGDEYATVVLFYL